MRRDFALAVALALTAGSMAHGDTFAAGSLIIPMDTTYQDAGMLRAYGLVYSLLRQGVPVRWVIQPGKSFQGVDFVASATDLQTNASVTNHGYRGGPWVIDSAYAALARPVVVAWQTASPNTRVHVATAAFSGTVARRLVVAPKIAVLADGNQDIARSYLMAAGIPDSTLNQAWPDTSPDILTPAEVSGPTPTNHHDGALFDSSGNPAYCQFVSMHWNVNNAVAAPEVVAEVREFLTSRTHFFAECQSVIAFENLFPYGFFLTSTGFIIKAQPSSLDNHNFDSTFAQYDGAFGTVGGSEAAFALRNGSTYKADGTTMITARSAPPGAHDLWMTGYLDGTCPPNAESCGSLGKVSYLGGHAYTTNVPISTNPKTQGTRLFLNSIFDSTCPSAGGQPSVSVADVKVVEGDSGTTPATFTVVLGADHAQTITVRVVTSGGGPTPPEATPGADYTSLPATVLTFAPGVTSQPMSVSVIGDAVVEAANESFRLTLSEPAGGAVLARAEALGIILDDDSNRAISLTPLAATVAEPLAGSVNATFTVTLSADAGRTITVDYATADGSAHAGPDYTPTSGTLSFEPGDRTKTIDVPVLSDLLVESPETFTLTLSAPTNGTIATGAGTATTTISDSLSQIAMGFHTVTPCRVVDTRSPAPGSPLAGGVARTFPIVGNCGIPPTARAISFNITVTAPTANGNVRLFPGGTPAPATSSLNLSAGQTRANNGIAALGASGDLGVLLAPAGTAHVIIDVNGYME